MDSKDISVVVQGAIDKEITLKCLKSIRKYLPCAEIILSTWENSDVENLAGLYDTILLNADPGATVFDELENKTNSLNRILVSSKSGIEKASRKYVLRLRSDLVLKNANVLKLTDYFPVRNSKSVLFKQRIFAYEIFSIKYDIKKKIKQRMLFHISDWCHFGLKEDLSELFNIPLADEPEFSRYFETHKKPIDDIHNLRLWKMSPEQYITSLNALKVFKDLKFENYLNVTPQNITVSEDFIINNFIVFSQKTWGIKTLKKIYKYNKMFFQSPFNYYSDIEQAKDYKKYCDLHAKISKYNFMEKLYDMEYFESLRKHFLILLYGHPVKKTGELLSVIFYLVKFIFSMVKSIIKRCLCRK